MLRKFAVLTISLVALAGLAFAADDETPTGKIMEQIKNKTNAIRKATRTAAEYKKSARRSPRTPRTIVKLAKEAREIKDRPRRRRSPSPSGRS